MASGFASALCVQSIWAPVFKGLVYRDGSITQLSTFSKPG